MMMEVILVTLCMFVNKSVVTVLGQRAMYIPWRRWF